MVWFFVDTLLIAAAALAWSGSRQIHLEPWKDAEDARQGQIAARALSLIGIALAFAAGLLL
jgi:hypothetical protein